MSNETTYDFRDGNGPVPAHQHPNGGGWVADTADVANSAHVGPDAKVYGYAKVYENAKVFGNAKVDGDARVYEDARVSGNAWVFGHALVYGNAKVFGSAKVYGNAVVFGYAEISENAKVYGTAKVSGNTKVNKGTITLGHIKETQDEYYEVEFKTANESNPIQQKESSENSLIISATDAQIKSDLNAKIKLENLIDEQMQDIHEVILSACESGYYHAKIILKDEIIANELFKFIETNLHQAGYKLDYNCMNKSLHIHWEYYEE